MQTSVPCQKQAGKAGKAVNEHNLYSSFFPPRANLMLNAEGLLHFL